MLIALSHAILCFTTSSRRNERRNGIHTCQGPPNYHERWYAIHNDILFIYARKLVLLTFLHTPQELFIMSVYSVGLHIITSISMLAQGVSR